MYLRALTAGTVIKFYMRVIAQSNKDKLKDDKTSSSQPVVLVFLDIFLIIVIIVSLNFLLCFHTVHHDNN